MRLVFILLVNLSLIACGQKNQVEEVKDSEPIKTEKPNKKDAPKKKSGWEEITKDGVTLDYPSEWKLDVSGKKNIPIVFFPNTDLAKSGFRDNINLTIQNTPASTSLDKIKETLDDDYTNDEGYELLKSNKKTLKRTDILNIEYKVSTKGYDLKYKQYFIIKNRKLYNLTFSADQKTYSKNIIKVIRLFNSIDIESENSSSAIKTIGSMDNKERNRNWKTFKRSGISIDFPEDWKVQDSKKEKVVLIGFPSPKKARHAFSDNVNVVIQNDSKGQLTTDYWADAIDKGNQKNEKYKLIRSRKKKLGSLDIHEIVYNSTTQGYDLRYFQYLIVKDKKAYNLTFTALQSTYRDNIDEVEKIFDSFEII